jgi:hypothetical protein
MRALFHPKDHERLIANPDLFDLDHLERAYGGWRGLKRIVDRQQFRPEALLTGSNINWQQLTGLRVPGIPTSFLDVLKRLPESFHWKEAHEAAPLLKSSSIRSYLSQAADAGLVEPIGRGRYKRTEPPEQPRPLSPLHEDILGSLKNRILPSALDRTVMWSNEDLAPFLHDAILDPFLVIEAPKHTLPTLKGQLELKRRLKVLPARAELGKHLWSHEINPPEIFLVASNTLKGTRPSGHGFQSPTPGRLLAIVLQVPALLPDTALQILESPGIKVSDAIHASPSKHTAAKLGALLAWIKINRPNHPVLAQAERFLPERMEAW